ncbi:MAG TPA: guanylate kinase [Candidatus Eisenbacteria bacterium]|nr:guanylate kinase [Candidatus Eisenbacteria bacterium]
MSESGSRSKTSSDAEAVLTADYRRFVIVVSGPSGAGKSTFVHELLRRHDDIVYSVSATSRPRREHEVEGEDYFYLDRDDFRRRIERGEFAEWAEVHGELYGTLRSQVDEALAAGKNVLLDIDVQGGRAVRRIYPDGVFIFILPPSMASLESRLRGRGTDSEERIRLRLENAQREIPLAHEYDYAVVNDDRDAAVLKVNAIVTAERCRASRLIRPRAAG